jgi:hypothetical protein
MVMTRREASIALSMHQPGLEPGSPVFKTVLSPIKVLVLRPAELFLLVQ